MEKNQNGFSVIEALLLLIIFCLIGFVGWYVWNAKRDTDKTLTTSSASTATSNKTSNASTAAQLPEGWVWYEGDGFKFGYPGVYGKFSGRSTSQVSGGIQAVLASEEPTSTLFPGITPQGLFVLGNYEAVNATIQSRKYGPEVKLENGKWIVTQDNPSDPQPYKVGATYTEVTTTKSGATVYTFKSGDEGGLLYTLAFVAKGHLYTLQLPEFDTGTYASQTPNDQKPYDQLSRQLAEHVISE